MEGENKPKKKILCSGTAERIVDDLLDGVLSQNASLKHLSPYRVVFRENPGKVALISGGGSGHEPSHAGYIGDGMLTAAVLGDVFTSPSVDSIIATLKQVTGPEGSLCIVKNYTGDLINFGLAVEHCISTEGLKVKMVVVADDCALESHKSATGCRGIAGTVLVHKIAGALAEEGASLDEVYRIAAKTIQNVRTMGVGLGSCTLPSVGYPGFELPADEMELGLGIHGEPGVKREKMQPTEDVIKMLLSSIMKSSRFKDVDHQQQRVALLLNNLGGTTELEMTTCAGFLLRIAQQLGLNVHRMAAGSFMTALDMPGISISVLALEDDLLKYLDADTSARGWPRLSQSIPKPKEKQIVCSNYSSESENAHNGTGPSEYLKAIISHVCTTSIELQHVFTEADQVVGDGDMGISITRGATQVLNELNKYPTDDVRAVAAMATTLRRAMGGSSGPMFCVFFLGITQKLNECGDRRDSKSLAAAFHKGVESVMNLGGARVGDCTLIDALVPAAQAFIAAAEQHEDLVECMKAVCQAAKDGAESTKPMQPKRGRASYLADRAIGHVDPGALAVSMLLQSAADCIASSNK